MNQPIRILHVVGVMDQGGIETLLMNLYRNIDRTLIQFDFLTHCTKKGFFNDEIISLGGKIYSVVNPLSFTGVFQYKKQLTHFFTEHPEYTIVHSHMNTFSGIILSIATFSGVKTCIAHSHTTIAASSIKTPLWKLSRLFGQSSISHYFACSRDAAKWSFNRHAEKSVIFKNAIDLEKYRFSSETRETYRNELNLNDKYIVGHVGRFNEIKNHNFLIDVYAKLREKKKDAVLLLVGDGPLLSDMRKKAKEMGIIDSIIFLGNRDDVEKLLCAMDIFVFPSTNEGLGIVAIEAQVSGLNCLVSDALPQEVKVTNLLTYASLKNGPDYWASHIQRSVTPDNRDKAYIEVKNQGYDIKESAKWLKNFYINCKDESKQDV